MITKEQITDAYDSFRDATIAEFELNQQEEALKLEKIKAHKATQMAREGVENLKAL